MYTILLYLHKQTDIGVNQTSYPMSTGDLFPKNTQVGAWNWTLNNQLVQTLGMREALPVLTCTPSWRGT
jgi:hypothetical protein